MYDTNSLGITDISTHYVVIGYRIDAPDMLDLNTDLPTYPADTTAQHSHFRWIDCAEAQEPAVHPNVLPYFDPDAAQMSNDQYVALNNRRDVANQLVWQTPLVLLTGLAFIFLVLLAGGTPAAGRWVAAAFAVIVCMAVYQLMAKQRFNETAYAEDAERYERSRGMYPLNRRRRSPDWLVAQTSVVIWQRVFLAAAVTAVVAAVLLTTDLI